MYKRPALLALLLLISLIQVSAFDCTETDAGLDANTAGAATGVHIGDAYEQEKDYADYCKLLHGGEKDGIVQESYCKDGYVEQVQVNCDYGCGNGACLEKPSATQKTCSETDNGIDPSVSGVTTGVFIGDAKQEVKDYADYCKLLHGGEKDGIVMEAYCKDNLVFLKDVLCDYGCVGDQKNGFCAPKPQPAGGTGEAFCKETDAGRDPEHAGIVTSNEGEYFDYCVISTDGTNIGKLSEAYCKDGKVQQEFIRCEGLCTVGGTTQGSCTEAAACDGCLSGNSCIPFGVQDGPNYCAKSGVMMPVRAAGVFCAENYECADRICKDGTCRAPCQGCYATNGNCVPVGTREDSKYCSSNYEWTAQAVEDSACSNNYECSSNVCVNNACISPSLMQRIINWFTSLFG